MCDAIFTSKHSHICGEWPTSYRAWTLLINRFIDCQRFVTVLTYSIHRCHIQCWFCLILYKWLREAEQPGSNYYYIWDDFKYSTKLMKKKILTLENGFIVFIILWVPGLLFTYTYTYTFYGSLLWIEFSTCIQICYWNKQRLKGVNGGKSSDHGVKKKTNKHHHFWWK